jgi:hypothetical protein
MQQKPPVNFQGNHCLLGAVALAITLTPLSYAKANQENSGQSGTGLTVSLQERHEALSLAKTLEMMLDTTEEKKPTQSVTFRCAGNKSQTLNASLDENETGYVQFGGRDYVYDQGHIVLVRVNDSEGQQRHYFHTEMAKAHRFRCEHIDTKTNTTSLIPCAPDVSLNADTILGAVRSGLYEAAVTERPDCKVKKNEIIDTIKKHFSEINKLTTRYWYDLEGEYSRENFSRNIDDAGTGKIVHSISGGRSCEEQLENSGPSEYGESCSGEEKKTEINYYFHSGILFFVFETFESTFTECEKTCKPVWHTQWDCSTKCDDKPARKRERRLYYSGSRLIRCLENKVPSKSKSSCIGPRTSGYWEAGMSLSNATQESMKLRESAFRKAERDRVLNNR